VLTEQPSLQSYVQRIGHELSAKAIVLLHENGQVLHHSGWTDDIDFPAMAALVAAMIAAGKSFGKLGENFPDNPCRLACDSDAMGLYTVAVAGGIWLAVLYEQPLNPGLFRMKVRRYSELLARLEVKAPGQWELDSGEAHTGANLLPVSPDKTAPKAIFTAPHSSLFGDISDDEIDRLFEDART
jgi:hypothetical protein